MDEYIWLGAYRAAALETDNRKLGERIKEVRKLIDARIGEMPIGDTTDERRAMADALYSLRVLWIERIEKGQADPST